MKTIHQLLLVTVAAWLAAPARADDPSDKKKEPPKATSISWKKTVVDKAFRSEGVAVADVNKDGKLDIIVGDVWYEAPDWKMHVIRKDRKFDPSGYSESFACFADDFNGDGWPDVIVIPFPGHVCHWYENPKGKPGPWKEHVVCASACNETPIYVDLFGTGKKVLVMGVQPIEKFIKGPDGRYEIRTAETRGQMVWLRPGKDPTQLWEMHPISDISRPGKEIPATRRFDHGLGHGDVNGDGRLDIICPAGWWEQPEKVTDEPWKFHPANLGPSCADMFTYDIDGDGKNDIVSTSAHAYGMWWHQQTKNKDGGLDFVRRDLFAPFAAKTELPNELKATKEEEDVFAAINKMRAGYQLPPLPADVALWRFARRTAQRETDPKAPPPEGPPEGFSRVDTVSGRFASVEALAKSLNTLQPRDLMRDGGVLGIGRAPTGKGEEHHYSMVVAGKSPFHLFSQSHALHLVDVNGDGLKDLVTGRRWWAHGAKGDPGSGGPAVLYWFEAKRDKKGFVTFTPHLIDDDSGIGTQFAIADINGDGLLDIIISNKRGVFVFEQVRMEAAPPARKE